MKKTFLFLVMTGYINWCKADYWTQMATYPGAGQELPVFFSIGNFGYAGCGTGANDFWEFDPVLNTWTQKASVPGPNRRAGVGFSINGKGYAGTGDGPLSDFYEFDPGLNTWTAKASLPTGRSFATGFSIGNLGYIGCGQSPFMSDFWEYDPVADTWTQKSSLPAVRSHSVGFSISGKGYMSTGLDASIANLNDMWEFDPTANTWTQMASIPAPGRTDASGFVLCDKGYVMAGGEAPCFDDLWQFDPVLNQWIQKTNTPGGLRDDGAAFSIGNKGYFGLGQLNASTNASDFWEYTPDSCSSIPQPSVALASSDTGFCEKQCIDFFDLSTNSPTSWYWYFPNATPDTSTLQNPVNICYNAYGTYDVRLVACNGGGCDSLVLPGFITVFQTPPTPVITQHFDTLFCSAAFTYAWYESTNPTSVLSTDSFLVCTQNGNYFVIITDSNGCGVASNIILINTGIEQPTASGNQWVSLQPDLHSKTIGITFTGSKTNATIRLINLQGELVYQTHSVNKQVSVPLSGLADGIYFVKIHEGNKQFIQKIIVYN